MRAMDVVGFSEKEQFTGGKETDSSMLRDDKSKLHLQNIAELSMCDLKDFEDALSKCVMVTTEEVINRILIMMLQHMYKWAF